MRWPPRPWAESALAAAIFIILSLVAARAQKAERVFGDAKQYHHASVQFAGHVRPVAAEGPFVFRIGTPWLASAVNPLVQRLTPPWLDALVDDATGLDDVIPFYAVNITACLLFVVLFVEYLRCFVASAGVRLLLVTAWMAQWHAPVRWIYFNPVNVEPLFLLVVIVALLAIEQTRTRSAVTAALMLAPLTLIGTLCRESMILVPLALAASRMPAVWGDARRWRVAAALAMPFIAWLAALVVTRQLATATNAYRPWSEPVMMLRRKGIDTWLLAWFFTFGPAAVALMAAAAGDLRRFLRRRPELAVWIAGCGVLAFAGGTDTERILGWAAPVVYVLAGLAVERHRAALRRLPAVIVLLVSAQLLSSRLLWPVPVGDDEGPALRALGVTWAAVYAALDRVLVIEHYYSNLWSFYGSRSLHAAILIVDVCFVAAVAVLLRRRAVTAG